MAYFSIGNFDVVGGGGSSGGGVTEDQVRELINRNNTEVVQGQIQSAVNQASSNMQSYTDTAVGQASSNMQSYTDTAVSQATSGVQTKIDTAVTNAAENYDDTKIYATYDDMIEKEPEGREDVLYIITDESNTRYIWNGSAYTAIEGRIGTDQISNLFNE